VNSLPLSAQIPVPSGNRLPQPGMAPQPLSRRSINTAEPLLSTNYRITFAGKAVDKPKGEISTLSCAAEFQVSGPMDDSSTPASLLLSGTLAEQEDGTLVFTYNVGLSVPVTTSPGAAGKEPAAPQVFKGNTQYSQHQATGILRVKPGKSYDLIKIAGVTYALTIVAEDEK